MRLKERYIMGRGSFFSRLLWLLLDPALLLIVLRWNAAAAFDPLVDNFISRRGRIYILHAVDIE